MKPAVQICSRDFDAVFFKLPAGIQTQIEVKLDRLGTSLGSFRTPG